MAANTKLAVATHILTILALTPEATHQKDHLVCSEAIAHSVSTNPVVVRRLVADLTRAGLVASYPGKGGGLALGRPAAQITLLEVYQAVGGETIFSFKAHTPNAACPTGAQMAKVIEQHFGAIEQGARHQLATTTLADIVGEMH